ncbi:MAG: hypothetical protein ACRDJU_08865 [Actinomycetota bacterium]
MPCPEPPLPSDERAGHLVMTLSAGTEVSCRVVIAATGARIPSPRHRAAGRLRAPGPPLDPASGWLSCCAAVDEANFVLTDRALRAGHLDDQWASSRLGAAARRDQPPGIACGRPAG